MDITRSDRDQALEELSSELVPVSARIVVSVFLAYLTDLRDVSAAKRATRARIRAACA